MTRTRYNLWATVLGGRYTRRSCPRSLADFRPQKTGVGFVVRVECAVGDRQLAIIENPLNTYVSSLVISTTDDYLRFSVISVTV